MAEWGVFGVARDIWDHPVLSDSEPFSKREAWMWLVSAAAWKPIKIGWRGLVVDLKRGEFCFALTFLAKRWRWAKTNVSRFLTRLKTADMITLQNRTDERDDTCVYSINNYNKYQVVGLPKRTDAGTESGPIPDRHRTQEGTFKHSNNQTGKKESSLRSPKKEAPPSASPDAVQEAAPPKPLVKTEKGQGTRWPPDANVPDEWAENAHSALHEHSLPEIDLRKEAGKFARYWSSKAGAQGRKADWEKTWINWAIKAAEDRQNAQRGRDKAPNAHEKFLRGGLIFAGHGVGNADDHERGNDGAPGKTEPPLLETGLYGASRKTAIR